MGKSERRRRDAERDARDAAARLTASEEERRAIRTKYVALGDRFASVSAQLERLRGDRRAMLAPSARRGTATRRSRQMELRRERKRAKRRVEVLEATHANETRELRASIEASRRESERDASVAANLRAEIAADKKSREEESSSAREALRASERAREEAETALRSATRRAAEAEEETRRISSRLEATRRDADAEFRAKLATEDDD